MSRTGNRAAWGPRDWLAVGLLAAVVGAVLGGVIGGDDEGLGLAVLGTVPGSLMVFVGLIAKAVQVGIKSAAD